MSAERDRGYPAGCESMPRSNHHHHHEVATTTEAFFEHSTAKRINTDSLVAKTLAAQYPSLELVIVPQVSNLNLLAYASAGFANFEPLEDESGALPASLSWATYLPPARRIDGSMGALGEKLNFGKFAYRWQGEEFLLYVVDVRDGTAYYSAAVHYYLLMPPQKKSRVSALLLEAGRWATELHGEILVFDQGYWQKSAALYASAMKASWDNVILDAGMKNAIIEDHLSFFESRDTYEKLQVPWKRGVIYHGPPGNGKTISIKAMMHTLYERKDPVPTLYVRSLSSSGGGEYSLKMIFQRAREFAPCYLVFEDLDSIVTDDLRSYFLNEVDGLKANDGIFMIGSTNHLDRLDPGISKRPSRFDRKYFFPDPDLAQRTAYCRFWQAKLAASSPGDNNPDGIEFPDRLCGAIARITDKFSFAYMQEAFVAALLAIARRSGSRGGNDEKEGERDNDDGWVDVCTVEEASNDGDGDGDGNDDEDLKGLVLWGEIKKQVKILREGMEAEEEGVDKKEKEKDVSALDIDETYKDLIEY
ncbi:ATPase [Biscogniauxia sp. FL1348]|nr:ATPase [Biscogniauxia sp. FL1348]